MTAARRRYVSCQSPNQDPAWLTEYFIGTGKEERSLAEITGLVIKR